MNNKAQTDIITFVALIVGLLILAPIMLYAVNQTLDGFSNAINGTSTEAADSVDYIQGTFVGFWDYMIGLAFLAQVILLFTFAFLVETHPFYSIFYMITAILTLSFSHYFMAPVTEILSMPSFSTEVAQLPITGFMVTYFDFIIFAIIIVTGIITYAKLRGNSGFQQ